MAIILSASVFVLLIVCVVVFSLRRHITVSLTFDDGLKSHYTTVAPLLEEFGWRGAFNVITDFLDDYAVSLTAESLKLLHLNSNDGALRMSWGNVIDLLARGHEVYPHTCSHVNLRVVHSSGNYHEIIRQIAEAKAAYTAHTGIEPLFFCAPFLDSDKYVDMVIKRYGMAPFSCIRPDIGGDNFREIPEILQSYYEQGNSHVDLMFHGIAKSEGGYHSFDNGEQFKQALCILRELELKRCVKIVPYSLAHGDLSAIGRFTEIIRAVRRKLRWFVRRSKNRIKHICLRRFCG